MQKRDGSSQVAWPPCRQPCCEGMAQLRHGTMDSMRVCWALSISIPRHWAWVISHLPWNLTLMYDLSVSLG